MGVTPARRVQFYGPKVAVLKTPPAGVRADLHDGPVVGFFHREYDGRANLMDIPGKRPGEVIPPTINLAGFTALGQAVGTQFQVDYGIRNVYVGRDYRFYQETVQNAVMRGLLATGINVLDIGMGGTPEALYAYYNLTSQTQAEGVKWGGVMITASHNPNGWSGLKLIYGPSQTFGPFELQRNEKILREGSFLTGTGSYRVFDGMKEAYLNDLASRPFRPARPLKVVVATFHGGGGLFLPEAMSRAGHEVIPLYTELDWTFPHGNPNPESHDNLKALGEAVRAHGADLGVSTDGDNDRVGIVDEKGNEVYADRAAMVVVDGILDQMGPNPTVVIDLKSSGAWERWVKFKAAGGQVVVVPTGHFYAKFGARKLGFPHWFERSGHFGLGEPFGHSFDDANRAALAFAFAVAKSGMTVSQLLSQFPTSFQSPNMQPTTTDESKYRIIGEVVAQMRADQAGGVRVCGQRIAKVLTMDGFADFARALGMPGPEGFGGRVVFEDGSWGLIRASANQPALVVLAESFGSEDAMKGLVMYLADKLKPYGIAPGSKDEGGSFDQFIPDWKGTTY